nr:hypothetical protein BaRGS_013675 [Batillaria attramentaria]
MPQFFLNRQSVTETQVLPLKQKTQGLRLTQLRNLAFLSMGRSVTTAKDPLLEKAEKNALTYVTGYLVKKISDKVCRGLGEFDLNLMPAYFGWVYRVDASTPYFTLYKELGLIVHGTTGKRMAISPFIDLNRAQLNATVERHVQGFETLAQTNQIDIIAVQLFAALEKSRDDFVGANSDQLELWLNVEAFEYLRDDPCLPVDPASSGMGEILNRASKNRVDKALTAASVRVQKVISFAWDSDYTCTTNQYRWSLAQEIRADLDKEIIASCSFHSPANKSIVLIGYNVGGHVEVNWPARGKRRTDESFGYYFETAWGAQHNRVPSLIYTQLWDLPNVLVDLDYKGWVSVKIKDGSSSCIFEYDFTHSAA